MADDKRIFGFTDEQLANLELSWRPGLFDGRVVLVSGGGSGLGKAIAYQFGRLGAKLVICGRKPEALERTAQGMGRLGIDCLVRPMTIRDPEQVAALFDAAWNRYGRLDVLVNNAGWAPARRPLVKISGAEQDRMLAVNLRAPIALTRLAAAQMLKQGAGTIINVASTAGLRSPAMEAIYAAAKAGLIAFTRACFAELRQGGVRVCVVIPGLVDTGLIPPNKHLERALMLKPGDIAGAVSQILAASPGACPVEIVVEPARNPERRR